MRITVKVKPGSRSQETVQVLADGSYEVRLREKPVDGKANQALLEVLANHFGVRQRDVTIIVGAGSRNKIVEIEKPA